MTTISPFVLQSLSSVTNSYILPGVFLSAKLMRYWFVSCSQNTLGVAVFASLVELILATKISYDSSFFFFRFFKLFFISFSSQNLIHKHIVNSFTIACHYSCGVNVIVNFFLSLPHLLFPLSLSVILVCNFVE